MKVKELIERLKNLDQELLIFFEEPYDESEMFPINEIELYYITTKNKIVILHT